MKKCRVNNGLTGVASHEVFGRRNDCAFEWCTCKYGDLGREAGESHLNQRLALERKPDEAENTEDRYFAGLRFNDNASDSEEERGAFSLAAVKHAGIPCQDERKLVSTNVMDACNKFYMWLLINKKEVRFL